MGKKVLVVDDEKLIVKGIKFSLMQDGMEVDCAYDGEEALELAKNNVYDLIIRFCFTEQIYNLIEINEFLEKYNCKLLGI